MQHHVRGLMLIVVGVLVGFVGGYYQASTSTSSLATAVQDSLLPVQEQNTKFTFVKPLLAYRTPEATTFGEYTDLKDKVQSQINESLAGQNVSKISFYFRDLDTARWVGINQNETYYPASLLKVPVLIAYYKQAEENPSILSEAITYQGVTLPPFDATSSLEVGKTYSVNELLKHMIEDSDNGATFTLLDHLNPQVLDSVYSALGITNPGDDSSTYQISTRTYSLFFRILYNATYLSPDYSQKALALLQTSTFSEGIKAGLPKSIPVAEKWGEHVLTDAKGKTAVGVELHDCGVIYYPKHPYLVCVMTSAKDVRAADAVIADISRTVQAAVKERYGS